MKLNTSRTEKYHAIFLVFVCCCFFFLAVYFGRKIRWSLARACTAAGSSTFCDLYDLNVVCISSYNWNSLWWTNGLFWDLLYFVKRLSQLQRIRSAVFFPSFCDSQQMLSSQFFFTLLFPYKSFRRDENNRRERGRRKISWLYTRWEFRPTQGLMLLFNH